MPGRGRERPRVVSRLVSLSTSVLASDADAAIVEAFVGQHGTRATRRSVQHSAKKVYDFSTTLTHAHVEAVSGSWRASFFFI